VNDGNNIETTGMIGNINFDNNNEHDKQYNTMNYEQYNMNHDNDISIKDE